MNTRGFGIDNRNGTDSLRHYVYTSEEDMNGKNNETMDEEYCLEHNLRIIDDTVYQGISPSLV
jgi:hypothetical protein